MNRRVLLSSLALAGIGMLGACDVERTSVLTPFGVPSYDSRLAADGRNVPNGTLTRTAAGIDTSIRVRFAGLEPLASGAYQVWLAKVVAGATPGSDSVLASVTKATGTVFVIRRDTTIDLVTGDPIGKDTTLSTTPSVSTFTAGGPSTRVEIVVNRASVGANVRTDFNVVFLSIETSATAAAPSDARPLYARYEPTTTSRALLFGRFHPRTDSSYVFTATGRGLAGIRGPILIVDDSSLARPPIGYFYAVAVVKRDTLGAAIDTLLVGPQTAPFPRRQVSLIDADVSVVDPVVLVTPPSILAAAIRVDARVPSAGLPGANPFAGFQNILVTLETKQGVEAASPTIILSGTVSGCVNKPGSC